LLEVDSIWQAVDRLPERQRTVLYLRYRADLSFERIGEPDIVWGMTTPPSRLGVVGTGWRAQYFLKLAQMLPAQFEVVGLVGRSRESTERLASRWSVRPFASLAELVADGRPDSILTAVPWAATPEVTRAAVELGVAVLSETPPAPDLDGLRSLWQAVGSSGLVQVAEQYPLMPSHASRLALIRSGAIGKATSVQVSSTHLYHAVALMRSYLGVQFEPAVVSARRFTAPLIDPLTRDAWTDDDRPKDAATTIATIDFGDSMALYDFTDNQWHNQLRSRRIVVRGTAGEVVDDEVVRLVGPRTIVRSPLVRRQTGYDLNLDGFDTDHISLGDTILYRNPFQGLRLSDEEIAIATMLTRMAAWRRGEAESPYPLADACQDHFLGLAIEQSVLSGAPVTTSVEAWAKTR
jgi:predicted dehydrogenase